MRVIFFSALLLAFILVTSGASAQTLAGVEQGIKPYGSYEGGNIDSISMVNGSITLNIPLISYPQRGGSLHVGYRLTYFNPWLQPWAAYCDPFTHNCLHTGYNLVYDVDPSNCPDAYPNGQTCGTAMGFADDFTLGLGFVYVSSQCCPQGVKYYTLTESDGAVHQMGWLASSAQQVRSVDATGYVFTPGIDPSTGTNNRTGPLWDRHGNQYTMTNGTTTRVEDPNGNFITDMNSQGAITDWTDTLGRNISGTNSSTTDFTHCPASTTSANLWTLPGPEGGTSQYKLCSGTINISFTPPGCTSSSKCTPTSTTANLMVGLVLPNLNAWTFSYDNFGELTNITLPTGGTISYTWTYINGYCVAPQYVDPSSGYPTLLWPYRRSVTSRTVNANDGTGPHTWNYAGIGANGGQSVSTDPLGNDTVHTETILGNSCSIYETEVDRYAGSHSSGTLLLKTTTTYNYSAGGGPAGFGNVSINVVPNTVTTTDVPSGKTSQVTSVFDSGVPLGSPVHGENAVLGDLLTQSYSDFGNGSPGPLLKSTNTTYMALSGPNASSYLANNLLSLPYTVQAIDGSGAQAAYTQYGYDEYSLANVGAITTQHDSAPPSGSYRGNLTSTHRWLNGSTTATTNCPISVNNGYLVGYAVYNDTGTLDHSVDSCGSGASDSNHSTSYSYSNTFVGAYPTTVTNALNQSIQNSYDFNTGLVTSTTDPNKLVTSYVYDNMWRLASVTAPGAGTTTITHQESTFPFTATLQKPISSNQTGTTTNVFDGFGRTTQTQLNDTQGAIFTDTTYDADGRVYCVSNLYRLTSDSTYGITTHLYDALGRINAVQPPDFWANSSASSPTCQSVTPSTTPANPTNYIATTYSGNCATVTDQAGRARTSCEDALGRLTQVLEDPGTSPHLNYETDYQYDALNNLVCAAQRGTNTGTFSNCPSTPTSWRPRAFSYDSLSRLLSANNPESGTTRYSYDVDGNVISKISPTPNWGQSQPGTPGTGTVTVSGSDRFQPVCYHCAFVHDTGTVSITVNGVSSSVSYGANSTATNLAASLASAINANTNINSLVSASASSSTVTITAIQTGTQTNYSLSASSASDYGPPFTGTSFPVSTSGSSLTGGTGPASTTITTSYAFDRLNRVIQKSYSDGVTPTAKYGYDAIAPSGCTLPTLTIGNGIGHRTGMCDAAGSEAWSYDITSGTGWKTTDARITNGLAPKTSIYQNNFAGSPATITYPSGRVITYTTDSAGRPSLAQDIPNSLNYAFGACANGAGTNGACYAPQGALASVQNGGSLYSTYLYNNRLQPCWLYATTTSSAAPTTCTQPGVANAAVLDYQYNFSLGAGDNGNVSGISNRRDNTRSQNFTYDSLNRLWTAQTQTTGVTIPNSNCWGLIFGYDPWGNLLQQSVTGPTGCSEPLPLNLSATSNNQIAGYCYDAAGNLLDPGACPTGSNPHTYVYDAENRLTSAGGVSYIYDGDGKRVQKSNGTIYWYGTGSAPLDETDVTGVTANSAFKEYIFFGGKRIARRDYQNNVNYYFADDLGTARVVTNSSGAILDDSDFYPFGGERPILSSSGNRYKFTGKERDSESGLDNFVARYSASSLGRFTSADAGPVNARAPQALNRYSYAANNPLRYTDPDGRYPRDQHEFFTFYLAVLAGRSDAGDLATGAGMADNWRNATTAFLGLGWIINYNKHFGKPPGTIRAGLAGGFDAHKIEDISGKNAPHHRGSWYHVYSNIVGHSVDTADKSYGGFRELGRILGIPAGNPALQDLEEARKFVNRVNAEVFQVIIGGQTHGQGPDDSWALVDTTHFGSITVNVYSQPGSSTPDFQSDPRDSSLLNAAKWGCAWGNPSACGLGDQLKNPLQGWR